MTVSKETTIGHSILLLNNKGVKSLKTTERAERFLLETFEQLTILCFLSCKDFSLTDLSWRLPLIFRLQH